MKFKKLASILVACAVAASLAACGSNDQAAEQPADTAADNAPAAAETASGLPALTKDEIHVGVVFNTEPGTEGFAYAMNLGF